MAQNKKLKTLKARIGNRRTESKPESDEDLVELESDVKKMAEKILEYRATVPDQLKITLASILSAQRPDLPHIDDGSGAGPSAEHNADPEEMELDGGGGGGTEEKIRLIKGKIWSNISTMAVVLERMKECISRIEKLESFAGIMHPAFEKTRLVDPMKVYFQL